MNFVEAIRTCLRKYATFSGKAGRSEFWYWVLFLWVLCLVAFQIDKALAGDVQNVMASGKMTITNIVNLILFLPTVAVSVRRLHDVNRSGWWFLLTFTVLGIPLLIYWYASSGKQSVR
ncbi:MAG: hypothetical protein BA863_10005 [Desulfovibrio sp. S3730MH75]|nr:MAG: hypothetical protein BA863_10005 [Desulfovibrio sp. S3730MH75]